MTLLFLRLASNSVKEAVNVSSSKLKEMPDGINSWIFKLRSISNDLQRFYETFS